MKRLTAFILILLLLCQSLPAVTAAEAVPANDPLTTGWYQAENGDYLCLAETDSVRSGYLVQKINDKEAYHHGVIWFEDILIIEFAPVPFEYSEGVLRFSFFGRDEELVFESDEDRGFGYIGVPGTLDLSGTVMRSADGTVVSFGEDGSGVLAQPGADPVPISWGSILHSATQASDIIVTLSYLSGITYENGILSFRTDDNTEIRVSPVSRTDITGTEVVSPEYNFRVILSDSDWTWSKEEDLYAFMRNDGLAWISLYDYYIGDVEISTEDIDDGLDAMISRLNGKVKGEYYDSPIAGLRGRAADFIYTNQVDFDCKECIFVAGEYAYYLTAMEIGEFSESTLQVLSDLADSFSFAE